MSLVPPLPGSLGAFRRAAGPRPASWMLLTGPLFSAARYLPAASLIAVNQDVALMESVMTQHRPRAIGEQRLVVGPRPAPKAVFAVARQAWRGAQENPAQGHDETQGTPQGNDEKLAGPTGRPRGHPLTPDLPFLQLHHL
jgi:hypothetical protein